MLMENMMENTYDGICLEHKLPLKVLERVNTSPVLASARLSSKLEGPHLTRPQASQEIETQKADTLCQLLGPQVSTVPSSNSTFTTECHWIYKSIFSPVILRKNSRNLVLFCRGISEGMP